MKFILKCLWAKATMLHVLTWFIFVDRCEQYDEQNKKFNFYKGDYDSITTALNKVNWQTEFSGKSAGEMWTFFQGLDIAND